MTTSLDGALVPLAFTARTRTKYLAAASLGRVTSFAGPDVPPGRYFVRVRAVNANGTSAPSNDVVIDVP